MSKRKALGLDVLCDETAKVTQRLADGEAVTILRFDLPLWHPARQAGAVGYVLVLGADNILRGA